MTEDEEKRNIIRRLKILATAGAVIQEKEDVVLLRAAAMLEKTLPKMQNLKMGPNWTLDQESFCMRHVDGLTVVKLSPSYFKIMQMLLSNPTKVFTYEELYRKAVVDVPHANFSMNVRTSIKRLRDKIGAEAWTYIKTRSKYGYWYCPPAPTWAERRDAIVGKDYPAQSVSGTAIQARCICFGTSPFSSPMCPIHGGNGERV